MHPLRLAALALVLAPVAQAQQLTDAQRLVGAWHLIHIDSPGPDGRPQPTPQPVGMLLYTVDGHLSVQLMYPLTPKLPSNEYVQDGYEASFGTYTIDPATHILTHHIQGSITRGRLVGQDLSRAYQFTPEGNLVLRSTRPDEHWSVTWQHY